jgi:4-diphosphocytidyl-2-methyl-D-erithritol synthase
LTFYECKRLIIALPDIHSLAEKVKKDERLRIVDGGDSRADSVREGFEMFDVIRT